jgi:hypothetical protein
MAAVVAPFRRQTGVVSIAPFGNGGNATDTRHSPSTAPDLQRLRIGGWQGSALYAPKATYANRPEISRAVVF